MDLLLRKTLVPFRLLAIHQIPPTVPLHSILIICILVGVIVVASLHSHLVFDNATNVRLLLDIFQGFAPGISFIVIVLEAMKSRRSIERIWTLIKEIVDTFQSERGSVVVVDLKNLLFRHNRHCLVLQALFLSIDFTIIIGVRRNPSWFHNRLVNFLGFLGSRTLILYYILYVRIVSHLLRSLVEEQRRINLKLVWQIGRRETESRRLLERQRTVGRIFSKVVRIIWLINDSFKYSLTVTFTTNIVCMAISWIWNYLSVRYGTIFGFGK